VSVVQPSALVVGPPTAGPITKTFHLRRLLLTAFLIRVACALFLHFTGYSRLLAPDEGTYASDGWDLALHWLGTLPGPHWRYSTGQPMGYFEINALFFAVFGQTEVPIKILNAAIGTLTIRYVFLIANQLYGVAVGRRAATLAAYFPSLILWSSVNIRDIWVILLLAFAAWQGIQFRERFNIKAIVLLALTVYATSRFRDYLVYVLLIPPIAAVLIGRREHFVRNAILSVFVATAGLLMLQQGIVGRQTEARLSLEAIAQLRQNMATGGSAFERGADISSPGGALLFLPTGLVYFFFSPFPWQVTSVLKALSLPEMLLLYYLVPSIIRGLRWTLRERFQEAFQMLLLTALIAVSYALGSGNIGTMYRHRAQAIVFVLIVASVGLELRPGRRGLKG
jgi:hypothetical protein